jgi:predicted CXXCH cytochrome family protein
MMKKLLIILMALIVAVGFYGLADAGITGSAHDFSTISWNSVAAEKCNVCHIPHNAAVATEGPLWNHAVTTASFSLYTSPTGSMDASVGQPAGASKLCLSCHDGTVALDSFGGSTGSTTITGDAKFGTDLSDDHPISFTYPTTDDELKTPVSGKVGTLPLFGSSSDQMECASCHDAHNTGAGTQYLLIVDNDSSALCLTCHEK